MKILVLIAHGSSLDAANREIAGLAELLQSKAANDFDRVVPAFLELAEPSIPDAIEECVECGADEVVLLPYFLACGKHVTADIPAAVREKQLQHPGVAIRLLDYFGRSPGIADALLRQAGAGK